MTGATAVAASPQSYRPALSVADHEMINVFKEALITSQAQLSMTDVFAIVMMVVTGISIIGYPMWKFGMRRRNGKNNPGNHNMNGMVKEMHTIITTKDADGIPFLQTIPGHMRKISQLMEKQTDILNKLHSDLHKE